jgi:hypothetical protein
MRMCVYARHLHMIRDEHRELIRGSCIMRVDVEPPAARAVVVRAHEPVSAGMVGRIGSRGPRVEDEGVRTRCPNVDMLRSTVVRVGPLRFTRRVGRVSGIVRVRPLRFAGRVRRISAVVRVVTLRGGIPIVCAIRTRAGIPVVPTVRTVWPVRAVWPAAAVRAVVRAVRSVRPVRSVSAIGPVGPIRPVAADAARPAACRRGIGATT